MLVGNRNPPKRFWRRRNRRRLRRRGGQVDLALNHLEISPQAYATIRELLIRHGYRHNPSKAKQFQYLRDITAGGKTYTIAVRPALNNGLVKEAIKNLRARFASPEHEGPMQVANFLGVEGKAEREQLTNDVFQTMQEFLQAVDKLAPG